MKRGPSGNFLRIDTGGEVVRPFLPQPLPPAPPLQEQGSLREELDAALLALGRLDSVTTLLPDTSLFLYMYVRKEAVLSSQIEGTQSSLSDLLLFELDEIPGVPIDDVREVSNYVAALNHGLKRVRQDGFPLSNRLLREVHGVLLAKGRGSEKTPGEFRTSQNWIGGQRPGRATFVPPPPEHVAQLMSDLEKFLHDEPVRTPSLLKAGLAHVQFETIHPFLDGNGRLGRLLITLLLCTEGILREPLLYLSLYFKKNREAYYDLLQRVRLEGDWEEWLSFFARGVRETAEQSVSTARRIAELFTADRERIRKLGRIAGSALLVHHALQEQPVLSIARAAEKTRLSPPTVSSVLRALGPDGAGILEELTGRRRNRLFGYEAYLEILNEGTEAQARATTTGPS